MSSFDNFLQALEDGVVELARKTLRGFKDEAMSDARVFFEISKDDLQRWTHALADGNLSQDDFEWLLLSRKDVAELYALKQTGLTRIRLDRFKAAFIDLVIDTAFDFYDAGLK